MSEEDSVLAGGGEAGALARATDWSQTPLGPVEGWSQALRSAAALVLNNEWGMLLWWGPEFVQIYNDAYRPVLGDKHPRAMGQRFRHCWVEVFHILGPMAEQPFRGGPAAKGDDVPLLIDRKVRGEETHFRLVYSPVPDDTVEPTRIGGVLAVVTEITEQVYAQRQLRTLRELVPHGTVQGRTVEAACADAAATLAKNAWDVPFALLYLLDEDGRSARLTATAGFADTEPGPRVVDLGAADSWQAQLAEAAHEKKVMVVGDLGAAGFAIPSSPWSEPPREAIVLPLASPDQPNAIGVLVCGVSPHRVLDTGYRTFFELVAGQVTTAIRDARALEQERKRLQALAEIDRAKTAFFSNVSHEFRTPLTLMLGPQRDALESGGSLGGADLEAVHRNTVRLLKLVNTLLEFSRAEAGRARASYQPTDLAMLTRDLASAFQSAVERGGLRFEVDCPALPEPVYVDRDMWERIVLNLLSNAFKFTFAGSIIVRQRAEGRNVVLEIADTGSGISAEELPRIFQRFHRVEGARARTHEGSGIGLALVHDTVALHGGQVTVDSQLGRGTTFRVSLPFGPAHLPADQITAASALADSRAGAAPYVNEALRWLPTPTTEAPAPTVVDARVLVADDNADMRDYIARLLRPYWTVDVVTDGVEALAHARAAPPDLILADVMMPNLDGFGLLRALRADPRTTAIPLIMLSARAGEDARLQRLQAGADDYLVKPFSARELLLRARTHLEAAAQRRATEAERHRLRALLAQLPASVNVLRGPELVVEFLHPVAAAALGNREVLGKPLLEAVPEFGSQEAATLLRAAFEKGEPIVRNEQLVHVDDGHGKQEDR